MRTVFFLLLLVFPALQGHVDEYPQDYFRSPLGIDLYLSGSFAEMRSNHFHSGLDIKTNNTEGYRIYAAADGWVSRVRVSPFGFGHALYVTHPNGYTTVYAHLSRFRGPLADYVKRLQYQKKSFDIDTYPKKNQFPVKKGEVIALSGNTGGSTGPHLHFEIRDASQRPVNPSLFGVGVRDKTPPRIFNVKLYPAEGGFVQVERQGAITWGTADEPVVLEAVATGQGYRLKGAPRIQAQGRLAFAIHTHDYQDGSRSRLGPYRIELTANGEHLFRAQMEKFSFSETRYLNAHVDYAERQQNRRWFQRSFILPGNPLPFYNARNRGYLDVVAGQTYTMAYRVEDTFGNTSRLTFAVEGTANVGPGPTMRAAHADDIRRTEAHTFTREGLSVRFPAGTFYEDLELHYGVLPRPAQAYSPLHILHDGHTPVHKYFNVSIRPEGLPGHLQSRAMIGMIDDDGDISGLGGRFENGYVTGRARTFGSFVVTVDTNEPTITPVNIFDGKDMRKAANIRVKIDDDLSGISSYEGTVDGQWVLFAYDAKRDLLTYTFDERVGPGRHVLQVTARDGVGNRASYRAAFQR